MTEQESRYIYNLYVQLAATIRINTYAKLDTDRDIADTIFNDSVKKAHNLYAEIKKVNNK